MGCDVSRFRRGGDDFRDVKSLEDHVLFPGDTRFRNLKNPLLEHGNFNESLPSPLHPTTPLHTQTCIFIIFLLISHLDDT